LVTISQIKLIAAKPLASHRYLIPISKPKSGLRLLILVARTAIIFVQLKWVDSTAATNLTLYLLTLTNSMKCFH